MNLSLLLFWPGLEVFRFLLWGAEALGAGKRRGVWLLKVLGSKACDTTLDDIYFKGQSDKVCES